MTIDSYENVSAENLLRLGRGRHCDDDEGRRLLITEAVAAAIFLAAAATLAALGSSPRSPSPVAVIALIAAYIIAGAVRFPVGSAWTAPTQLVFVSMLFVLPPAFVPLIVAACSVIDQLPGAVRGHLAPARVLARVADAFYALGPAIVFVGFGITGFSWGRWPVFVLAFVAQVTADAGGGLTRTWVAERIPLARQWPMLWLYLTEACLSCVGLVIAASAAGTPELVLLALPLVGLLWLLARERAQRLDYALALSTAYRGTAALVGHVAEPDGYHSGAHSRDVVDLARATAEVLGLDAGERRVLEFVAMLHDVGKLSVPKDVLNKPGQLEEEERAVVRRQTIAGEQLLEQFGGAFARVGRYVRASHEHYDGRGYPDGLAGDRIPIQSRIVCACEAFSAMTSERPYRTAMTSRDALGELRRCAGRQFDPQVVDAIERVVGSGVAVASLHPFAVGQGDWASAGGSYPRAMGQPPVIQRTSHGA